MNINMKYAAVSTETYKVGGGFMVDIIVNKEKTPTVYEAWLYHEKYGIKELMFGWYSGTYKEFVDMVKANLENEDYIHIYRSEYMEDDAEPKAEESKTHGIQVIYTGGGIWLAIKRLESDPHIYAVVDNEWENCVTYYDDRYDDYEFACQQMVDSRADDDMSDADKVVWEELKEALDRGMCR